MSKRNQNISKQESVLSMGWINQIISTQESVLSTGWIDQIISTQESVLYGLDKSDYIYTGICIIYLWVG